MYRQIHCSNLSPILELSLKFVSQICHENINTPLDGAYLADFGIDISTNRVFYLPTQMQPRGNCETVVFDVGNTLTHRYVVVMSLPKSAK